MLFGHILLVHQQIVYNNMLDNPILGGELEVLSHTNLSSHFCIRGGGRPLVDMAPLLYGQVLASN